MNPLDPLFWEAVAKEHASNPEVTAYGMAYIRVTLKCLDDALKRVASSAHSDIIKLSEMVKMLDEECKNIVLFFHEKDLKIAEFQQRIEALERINI